MWIMSLINISVLNTKTDEETAYFFGLSIQKYRWNRISRNLDWRESQVTMWNISCLDQEVCSSVMLADVDFDYFVIRGVIWDWDGTKYVWGRWWAGWRASDLPEVLLRERAEVSGGSSRKLRALKHFNLFKVNLLVSDLTQPSRTSSILLCSVQLFAHSIGGHWMSTLPRFPAK